MEDDEAVSSVARRVLQRAGYTVLATASPDEALALEAGFADPIHLLVTEVVMPGLSGRQVAERVRGRRPDLAVLYISGYTENAVATNGVVDPGTWFLAKPFTGATLLAKVREVLDAG